MLGFQFQGLGVRGLGFRGFGFRVRDEGLNWGCCRVEMGSLAI